MNNLNREAFEALRAADPAAELRAETPPMSSRSWMEAVTDDPTPVAQGPRTDGRRRTFALVGAPLALVAAAAGLVVAAQEGLEPTTAPPPVANAAPDNTIACSAAIVVGDVLSVSPSGPGRVFVEMAIDEWIKPASGAPTARFDLIDHTVNGGEGVNDPFRAGDYIVLLVPQDRSEAVAAHTGDDLNVLADQYREDVKNPDAMRPCLARDTQNMNNRLNWPKEGSAPSRHPTSLSIWPVEP